MKQVNEQPVPPSQKNRLITPALEQVVMRALAKDSALRFHSAREMADELERVRRGLGVSHDTQQATAVIGAYAAAEATRVMGADTSGGTAIMPPPGPPRSDQPKRSALPWILVALLLLASAVVGYVVYQQLQGPGGMKVPDVTGQPVRFAKEKLTTAGFKTRVEQRKSSFNNQGLVLDTDPSPGSHADQGSTVVLFVGAGPNTVDLPDLHGKSLAEALQILSDKHLEHYVITQVTSKLAGGTVVRTDPPPGPVKPTDQITLFVSNGNVKVPNVVGMTCNQATQALQGVNLQGDCVDTPSDSAPAGQVFAQSPSAGQPAPQGSTVTLQVSTGPAQVTVPDVTNTDYESAKKILHDNGELHAVRSNCLSSDPSIPDGVVVATDPPAGKLGRPQVVGDRLHAGLDLADPLPMTGDGRIRVAVLAGGRAPSTRSRCSPAPRWLPRSIRSATTWCRCRSIAAADGRSRHRRSWRSSRALTRGRWSGGPPRTLHCRPRQARSTSSCRSCTGRSAKTAPCRGCWRCLACRTSGRACSARR